MTTKQVAHNSITWTNIVRATPEDVEAIRRQYSYIHPLNLEDVLSRIERPKIDEDDDYLFIVMHFPHWDPDTRLSRASEVDLFVGRGYVITIHEGILKPLNRLFQKCENSEDERKTLLGRGSNHIFYTIIDQLVDYIFPILRHVDANIHDIEEGIFTDDTRRIIRDIAITRRDVIALRRIIRHQVPIVEKLEARDHPIIHEDFEEYFDDIADHLRRARDIMEENYEILVGLSETAEAIASHRINEVMRILTVISVIMLPLTLVSSIYGMNTGLPFQNHPNAFIIISGIMVSITILMLLYFRKRNWL